MRKCCCPESGGGSATSGAGTMRTAQSGNLFLRSTAPSEGLYLYPEDNTAAALILDMGYESSDGNELIVIGEVAPHFVQNSVASPTGNVFVGVRAAVRFDGGDWQYAADSLRVAKLIPRDPAISHIDPPSPLVCHAAIVIPDGTSTVEVAIAGNNSDTVADSGIEVLAAQNGMTISARVRNTSLPASPAYPLTTFVPIAPVP